MKKYSFLTLSLAVAVYATPTGSIQWSNCNRELQDYFELDFDTGSTVGLLNTKYDAQRGTPQVHSASSSFSKRATQGTMKDKLKQLEKELLNTASEAKLPFYNKDPTLMIQYTKLEQLQAVLQLLDKQEQGLLRLHCGSMFTTFDPQFNPETVSNQNIKLNVFRVSKTNVPDTERTHYWGLQGGPGGSGIGFIGIVNIWDTANLATDYFVPDHRGTGYSNFVHCPNEFEYSGIDECAMNQCTDVSDFSITNAATDLKALIDAVVNNSPVEPKRVTVHGISYGTSWGQRYLQLFPKSHVSKFILEGVVDPPGLYLNMFHRGSQYAGEVLLAKCALDDQCKNAFPNGFESMKDRMDTFISENTPSGNATSIDIKNDCISLANIRLLLNAALGTYTLKINGYNVRPVGLAYVHRSLRCNENDKKALLNLREYFGIDFIEAPKGLQPSVYDRRFSNIVSQSIRYSELTTDDYPSYEEYMEEFKSNYFYVPQTKEQYQANYEAFLQWETYELDRYAKSYFTDAEADVLFINGELDVQTPGSSAKLAYINSATKNGHGTVLAMSPNGGHAPSSEELPCARTIISEFISLPKGESPDLSCTLGSSSPDLNAVPAPMNFGLPENIAGTPDIFGDGPVIDLTKLKDQCVEEVCSPTKYAQENAFRCIVEEWNTCGGCLENEFSMESFCGGCDYHCGMAQAFCNSDEIEALGCTESTEVFDVCEQDEICTFSKEMIDSYISCLLGDRYGGATCTKCDPVIKGCMDQGCGSVAPCLAFQTQCSSEPAPKACAAPSYDVCESCGPTMDWLDLELIRCREYQSSCSDCYLQQPDIVQICTTNCEGQCDVIGEYCPSNDAAPYNCTGSPLGECDKCELNAKLTDISPCLEWEYYGPDSCEMCLSKLTNCEGNTCLPRELCSSIHEFCGTTYSDKYNCGTFPPSFQPTLSPSGNETLVCQLEEIPDVVPTYRPTIAQPSASPTVLPDTNESMLTIILIAAGVVGSLGLVGCYCVVSKKKSKNVGRIQYEDTKLEAENPLAHPL